MSRQRTFSILVIVSLFSLLVAGGVSIYIRNRRNRLIDMEERLEALRQLLDESRQSVAEEEKPDSAFFRKVLLQQLGVIRLMATTPTQQNKELLQQMTRITNEDVPVDTLLVWDDLYPIIDAVYDNFHTHLVRLSDAGKRNPALLLVMRRLLYQRNQCGYPAKRPYDLSAQDGHPP